MINNEIHIITNNPLVFESYCTKVRAVFVQGGYLEVLKQVRNRVHEGYKLITHPLMGSIKPNETPYRSLIIEGGDSLDLHSLEIIESSIYTCEKFLKDNNTPEWLAKVLEDFQYIDEKLLESAFLSL